MNKLLTTCLIIGFLISYSIDCYSQTTFLQHFSTKNGLPSNNCYFTLQDSKGYIWIATDAGVSRFDGTVFENFSVDDGLPDNQILQLKEDSSGRIWFLALNGQLSYFFNGTIYNENNHHLLKLLKFNAVVVSFFQDSKGVIWLGTNKNVLVKWDKKTITKYISASVKHQFSNTFIHEDRTGTIWAFSDDCARIFDGKTFKLASHANLPLSYKTAINLPDRTMAYIGKNGLNIKSGSAHRNISTIDSSLLNSDQGYFYLDKNSDIWLSNRLGIYQLKQNGIRNSYLKNISSSQVIKDIENNMWFTTNNGIYMLPAENERLYILNKETGLSSDVVKSLIKDQKDRLWLGYDNATIDILYPDKRVADRILLPEKKKYNTIKQLSLDPEHPSVYFASEHGMGRINKIYAQKRELEYLKSTDHSKIVLKNFSIGANNKLALATSSRVIVLHDRLSKFEFSQTPLKPSKNTSFFNNRAYCVFYDQQQSLWFSNIDGLSEFTNKQLYPVYQGNEFLEKRINDIRELNDGTIVLATDGYGVIYLKNRRLIAIVTQREGLSDNICKKLFVKDNNVWAITNSGINKISFDGKNADVETFAYTNALLNNDVHTLFIDNSNAYFGTNNGLVYFSLNKANSKDKALKLYISAITTKKGNLPLDGSRYLLNPADNSISFRYSAIDFGNGDITYRYRLKANASWTETKSRMLEFSSLEPGEYVFELCARSDNSVWSKPVKVHFIRKAHFWQTMWFLGILLLAAGFGLYKLAMMVTRRQKNKEKEQLMLKNKILMLEQRALQAMMNPHFVFNVMNSIQHYINTKDTTSANKILTGFAKLVRKNLEICTKSFITLEEELAYLELYLSLEKKRFGDKLNYTIIVQDAIEKEEVYMPSMLLQPYVENAIWHGIMPKEHGGKIEINIDLVDNNYLLIKIIDDGIGIDNSLRTKKDHQSKGMDLTKERINLLNQVEANPIHLEVKQNGLSGTFVLISVPLKP